VATLTFEETLMKRVLATLVLSFSIATLVGCGSGTPTTPAKPAGTPTATGATK